MQRNQFFDVTIHAVVDFVLSEYAARCIKNTIYIWNELHEWIRNINFNFFLLMDLWNPLQRE